MARPTIGMAPTRSVNPVAPGAGEGLVRRARHHQDGIGPVEIGEQALQLRDLRQVVIDDIGVVRIPGEEILVIVLGRVEAAAELDGGDDRGAEDMGLAELGDIGLGDLCLPGVGGEDRRAVLGGRASGRR